MGFKMCTIVLCRQISIIISPFWSLYDQMGKVVLKAKVAAGIVHVLGYFTGRNARISDACYSHQAVTWHEMVRI